MSTLRTLASLAIAVTMLFRLAMATTFTVGGSTGGWDTSTNLQTWASSQKFSVGDNLSFQYSPNHDVLEVSKTDYDTCTSSNPIQMSSGGATTIPLVSSGKRYFICGTTGHCSLGMKVEIDMLAASNPPTPPASPPANTTPPPPISPPANTTPPPPASPPANTTSPPPVSPPANPTPPPPASPPANRTSPSPASPPANLTPSPPASPPATPTPPPKKTRPSPPVSSPPTETPTYGPVKPPASGNHAYSPSVSTTESPANSPSPSVSSPQPSLPFSAAKKKLISWSAMGFALVMIMLQFF